MQGIREYSGETSNLFFRTDRLVSNIYIKVEDHLGNPIRSLSGQPLVHYISSFNYTYEYGEEVDEATMILSFMDVKDARTFVLIPGLQYHIWYGYQGNLSACRELVITEINKKANKSGLLVELKLVPVCYHVLKNLPVTHERAWDLIQEALNQGINLEVLWPYDRHELNVVNSDIILDGSKEFDPLNDKYFSIPEKALKQDRSIKPTKGGYLYHMEYESHRYGPGRGKPEELPEIDFEVLTAQFFQFMSELADRLNLAESHARDGKLIVKDWELEQAPVGYYFYGQDSLISWEVEETDDEVQAESEYQAIVDESLKESDILRVDAIEGPSFNVYILGGSYRVLTDDQVDHPDDYSVKLRVYQQGEHFYVRTDDMEFAQRATGEHRNFLRSLVAENQDLYIARDGEEQSELVRSLLRNFSTVKGSPPYMQSEDVYQEVRHFPLDKFAQIDNMEAQRNIPQPEGRKVSQFSLEEWAQMYSQVYYRDQYVFSESTTLVEQLSHEPSQYPGGYLRNRIAKEMDAQYPYDEKTLAYRFMKDTMEQQLHRKVVNLEIEGDPKIEISQVIYFEGIDGYDTGTYYIKSSEHTINHQGYFTKITALKIPPDLSWMVESIERDLSGRVRERKQELARKVFHQFKDEMGKPYDDPFRPWGYYMSKGEFTAQETYRHLPHVDLRLNVVNAETETE